VSNAILKVRREIDVLGPSALPVVIVGPTGTGKEIIARELLLASARSAKAYITVNCASLGTLSDSELFGHARGSFTSAHCDTDGHIGSASGGTLLLDEVEALSMNVQAKLLRFLDSGEYCKVGESRVRHADVRIISASNRDLDELCEEGKFRRDLLYRLSGAIIRTTSLRERREDIPLLVRHFLAIFAVKGAARRECRIDDAAVAALRAYDWPGNARQLKQTIHLLCERHPGATVTAEDVADILGGRGDGEVGIGRYQEEKTRNVEEFDKRYFTKVLVTSGGSAKTAMELTGMHKKNFYKKLKELGFSMRDFK
jgi:DNA-binding NtrC family response regulator